MTVSSEPLTNYHPDTVIKSCSFCKGLVLSKQPWLSYMVLAVKANQLSSIEISNMSKS